MTEPAIAVTGASQQFQKIMAIVVIEKNSLTGIPTHREMINCTSEFNTQKSGHDLVLILGAIDKM